MTPSDMCTPEDYNEHIIIEAKQYKRIYMPITYSRAAVVPNPPTNATSLSL